MATENETTVPEMTALTAAEIAKDDPTGVNTLLYAIRGLGADRDRNITMAELLNVLNTITKKITLNGSAYKISIDASTGEIYIGDDTASFILKADGIGAAINNHLSVEGTVTGVEGFLTANAMKAVEDITATKVTGIEITSSGVLFKTAGAEDATKITKDEVDTGTVRAADLLNACEGALIVLANQVTVGQKLRVANDASVEGKLTVSDDIEMTGSGFLRLGGNTIASDSGAEFAGVVHAQGGFQLPVVEALPTAADGTAVILYDDDATDGKYKLYIKTGGAWRSAALS